jgi:ankyrin repeat protein
MIKLLIERGAAINIKTKNNDTSLHIAIRRGDYEMSKLLIEKGAEVDVCLSIAGTALHTAAGMARPDLVNLLLDYGANVNSRDNSDPMPIIQRPDKNTPLHYAAWSRNMQDGMRIEKKEVVQPEKQLEVANLLISHGAKINIKNSAGQTPYFLAVEQGNKDIAKLLRNLIDQ